MKRILNVSIIFGICFSIIFGSFSLFQPKTYKEECDYKITKSFYLFDNYSADKRSDECLRYSAKIKIGLPFTTKVGFVKRGGPTNYSNDGPNISDGYYVYIPSRIFLNFGFYYVVGLILSTVFLVIKRAVKKRARKLA